MNNQKIYVSCSLGGVMNDKGLSGFFNTLDRYDALGRTLGLAGFNPIIPHQSFLEAPYDEIGLKEYEDNVTPRDVYNIDLMLINDSEAALVLLDDVSHGVGAEIPMLFTPTEAVDLGASPRPILFVAKEPWRVSRFIRGMIHDYQERGYPCKLVQSHDDVSTVGQFKEFISETQEDHRK